MSYHTYLVSDDIGLLIAVVCARSSIRAVALVREQLGVVRAFGGPLLIAERIAPGFARDIRECVGSKVGA